MKKLWLSLLFFAPVRLVAVTSCYNGCPATPSDYPNLCDTANWAVDRRGISDDEIKVTSDRLYIRIKVTYKKPNCARQGNVRPYDTDGVRLYLTAQTSEGFLGNYVIEGKPEEHDLGLGTILVGPITMTYLETRSNNWDILYFETPNGGIPLSTIKPMPTDNFINLKLAEVVLYSTNGEFRPVGRGEFRVDYKEEANFEVKNGAYILTVNGEPLASKEWDDEKGDYVYSYKKSGLYNVKGEVIKGEPNNPPEEAQENPYDPPPTRGNFAIGDKIEIGMPEEDIFGFGMSEHTDKLGPPPTPKGDRWENWTLKNKAEEIKEDGPNDDGEWTCEKNDDGEITEGCPKLKTRVPRGDMIWYRGITTVEMPGHPLTVEAKLSPKILIRAERGTITVPSSIWNVSSKEIGRCVGTNIEPVAVGQPITCARVFAYDQNAVISDLIAPGDGILDHWVVERETGSVTTPGYPYAGFSRNWDKWDDNPKDRDDDDNMIPVVLNQDWPSPGDLTAGTLTLAVVPNADVTIRAIPRKFWKLNLVGATFTGTFSPDNVNTYWYPGTRYDGKNFGYFYEGQRVSMKAIIPEEAEDEFDENGIQDVFISQKLYKDLAPPDDERPWLYTSAYLRLAHYQDPKNILQGLLATNLYPKKDMTICAETLMGKNYQLNGHEVTMWEYDETTEENQDSYLPYNKPPLEHLMTRYTSGDCDWPTSEKPTDPVPHTLTISGGNSVINSHWSWDNRKFVLNDFTNEWVLRGTWNFKGEASSGRFYAGDTIFYHENKVPPVAHYTNNDGIQQTYYPEIWGGFHVGDKCGPEPTGPMPDHDLTIISSWVGTTLHDMPAPHGKTVKVFGSDKDGREWIPSTVCEYEDGWRGTCLPDDYVTIDNACEPHNLQVTGGTILNANQGGKYMDGDQVTIQLNRPPGTENLPVKFVTYYMSGTPTTPGIAPALEQYQAKFLKDGNNNFNDKMSIVMRGGETKICISYRVREWLSWKEINNFSNSIPEAYEHTLPPTGDYAGLSPEERYRYLELSAQADQCQIWPSDGGFTETPTNPVTNTVSVHDGGFHISTGAIGVDSGLAYRWMDRHWVYDAKTNRWEMIGTWVLVPPELQFFNEKYYPNEVVNLVPRNTNACEEFKGWELSEGADGRLAGNLYIVGDTNVSITAKYEYHNSDWWWVHFDRPDDGMQDGIFYCDYTGCNSINRHDLYLMCGETPPEEPTEPPPTSGIPTYKFKVSGGVMDSFARGEDTFYENAGLTEFEFREGDQVWLQSTVNPPNGCYLLDGIFNPPGDYWYLNLPEPNIHMFQMPPYNLTLVWAYSCNNGFSSVPVQRISMLSRQNDEVLPTSEFSITNSLAPVGNPFMLHGESNQGTVQSAGDSSCVAVKLIFDSDRSKLTQVGDRFEIHLPQQPSGVVVHLYRYSQTSKSWVRISDTSNICLSQPGIYQAFAHTTALGAIGAIDDFGNVFVFPNPSQSGNDPTLHIEMTQVDHLAVRIYDVGGDVIYSANDFVRPSVINGKSAYERKLDRNLFKAGVYMGTVTASKAGQEDVRKKFKFTVEK